MYTDLKVNLPIAQNVYYKVIEGSPGRSTTRPADNTTLVLHMLISFSNDPCILKPHMGGKMDRDRTKTSFKLSDEWTDDKLKPWLLLTRPKHRTLFFLPIMADLVLSWHSPCLSENVRTGQPYRFAPE